MSGYAAARRLTLARMVDEINAHASHWYQWGRSDRMAGLQMAVKGRENVYYRRAYESEQRKELA